MAIRMRGKDIERNGMVVGPVKIAQNLPTCETCACREFLMVNTTNGVPIQSGAALSHADQGLDLGIASD